MPHYNRPGTRYYATAVRELTHKDPCVVNGIVGTAQKQKAPAAGAAIGAAQTTIAVGEDFVIVCKGIVEVPYVATAAKGSPIYIDDTNDTLTLTATANVKFGLVVEIQGQRGTPTGFMRVDLDKKDTF